MSYTNKLKSAALIATGTLALALAGVASAGHVVRKEVYHPNHRTTIVNKRICGRNGCVNVHRKIKYRRNGTVKVIKKRCRDGFCNKRVVIKG